MHETNSWLTWQTCLRTLQFGYSNNSFVALTDKDKLTNIDAYAFFLEVICGLHSPMIGETEVMGQFRDLAERTFALPEKFSGSPFILRIMQSLLADAKKVRATALLNLGSRSYGSLIRRFLEDAKSVSVVGAGHLTSELLPWLKSVPKVKVHCRRLAQGEALGERFPFIEVKKLGEATLEGHVIIAAPLSSIEIYKFLEKSSGVEVVIDFRHNSAIDAVNCNGFQVVELNQLFNEIKGFEKEAERKVEKAREMIRELSEQWFHGAEIRPFGWDDLCG